MHPSVGEKEREKHLLFSAFLCRLGCRDTEILLFCIIINDLFQLAMSKRSADNEADSYELDGPEALGSYLRIQPCSGCDPELLECLIQWYRLTADGGKKELISGMRK